MAAILSEVLGGKRVFFSARPRARYSHTVLSAATAPPTPLTYSLSPLRSAEAELARELAAQQAQSDKKTVELAEFVAAEWETATPSSACTA